MGIDRAINITAEEQKTVQKGWKQHRLLELCDITRGASPRPIHDWVSSSGVPWVKIADASATTSRFIEHTREYIRFDGQVKSVTVYSGDLILSNSASPGIPKFMAIEACIHDGWLLLRNFRNLDRLFAYYLLLHERDAIVGKGTGSVFTNLKTDILKQHSVTVPTIPEQRAIAHILGTLDDKIELNRRMNETLEVMARALFKSWFVDFDPVRAKMAGHDPGIPQPLADLFPDALDDKELPKGWRRVDLGQVITVLETGKRPRGGVSGISEGVPSVGAESITRVGEFVFSKTKYVPREFFSKMLKGHILDSDVLIYKDGGKPGELRPAVTYVSKGFPFAEFCVNEHVFRIRTETFSQQFLYCLLSTEDAFWQMRELATGVAQPGLTGRV